MANPVLESFGESPKACVTNSSRPPEKLKGKENPDLPSVCSNYWPPNVASHAVDFDVKLYNCTECSSQFISVKGLKCHISSVHRNNFGTINQIFYMWKKYAYHRWDKKNLMCVKENQDQGSVVLCVKNHIKLRKMLCISSCLCSWEEEKNIQMWRFCYRVLWNLISKSLVNKDKFLEILAWINDNTVEKHFLNRFQLNVFIKKSALHVIQEH